MSDEVEIIDLNQADVEKLTTLPGIGSVLAKRIVEYRQNVHPFEEVIELAAVPGISERTVRSFEDRVTVVVPEVEEAEVMEAAAEFVEAATPEMVGETGIGFVTAAEEEDVQASEPEALDDEVDEAEPIAAEVDVPATEGEETEPDRLADLALAGPPPRAAAAPPDDASQYRPVVADEVDSPPIPPDALEKKAQRRGCFALVAGAVLGAVVGAILSLAIIAQLNNGTLSFYQADTQLRRDLNGARQAQEDLEAQLGVLDTQAANLATRSMEMTQQQEDADETLAELQQTITGIQREMEDLERVTVELDERLVGVAAAAETFNTFLNGLRDLLFELQGTPHAPEPTVPPAGLATPTETATPGLSADETPEATATSAGLPTRTPRPTATPFESLSTSTPEPQP